MKTKSTLLVALIICAALITKAQISGTVFRDFNGNGVKDNSASFNEPFIQGITAKEYIPLAFVVWVVPN